MRRGSFGWLRATALALALVVTAGCDNPLSSSDDGTRIRLRNASPFELTNVSFWPGPDKVSFARIAPLQATEYTRVSNAYSYGTLDVLVAGDHRRLQVIDFVGESYLDPGKYTYVITIDVATKNPSVRLVED
jgi:hypothetical protein